MKGVGIIGAGVIFDSHASAWGALGDRARCIGIAEIDERKRMEATGKYFLPVEVRDYRDLLKRDDVDIVCICTPPFLHEQMVVHALEAGKYVLCEKPLAPTLAAIDRIIDIAAQYPGRLSTIYQLRFSVEMQKLLWLVEQGHLGRLVSGKAARRAPLHDSSALSSGWWGRWKIAGGGMVMTQFVHHLDQLICIFGRPQRVEATMATEHQPIESEDTFAATITFESGVLVACEGTLNAPRFEWGLEIIGESMSAVLPWSMQSPDQRHRARVEAALDRRFPDPRRLSSRLVRKFKKLMGFKVQGGLWPVSWHEPYFRAVLDAIDGERPLPIPPVEARASVELCTAIYTSAINGTATELPLDSSSVFYQGVTVEDYRNACTKVA